MSEEKSKPIKYVVINVFNNRAFEFEGIEEVKDLISRSGFLHPRDEVRVYEVSKTLIPEVTVNFS